MEHEAVFRFTTPRVEAIYRALMPETTSDVNPRSTVSLSLENGKALVLRVQAEDIPAFRAALNMWLRLVNVADEMQEIV
jgi:KEOPS complex subunit Pcc1